MEMEEGPGGQLGKGTLEHILMQAMFAAKNVRAQRDRLLQLRRRLQQRDDDAAAAAREVASGLYKASSKGLQAGASYLSSCLGSAYDNGAHIAFTNPAFAFIRDEQLYDVLHAQRLPASPTTQTEALTRIEVAYFALNLSKSYHIPRCIEFLVGVRPPSDTGKPDEFMMGYADDMISAATDHIYKTRFPNLVRGRAASDATENIAKISLADPGPAASAATERSAKTRPRLSNRATGPAAAAAGTTEHIAKPRLSLFDDDSDTAEEAPAAPTWEPPHVASSKDPDQALSYLHRAFSLASLAVKHIDVAVAVISTFLDPKDVAETAEMADESAYTSDSEEGSD